MPKKLTDTDLESLENVATKEIELIQEGIGYVKDYTALRIFKVISLVLMEWLFYFITVASLVAFIYLMFFNSQTFLEVCSKFVNVNGVSNEEGLLNTIKIIRLVMFLIFIIFFITALQFRSLKKKIQNNNNVQLVFEELKELINRRKKKFNI